MNIKLKDGRFTIPKVLRDMLKLKPNDEIKIELVENKLIITNAK